MNDPEFPGEEEYLYFVMVEFNVEDIRELRRITQLELTGTLDADGLKAFVEVSYLQISNSGGWCLESNPLYLYNWTLQPTIF